MTRTASSAVIAGLLVWSATPLSLAQQPVPAGDEFVVSPTVKPTGSIGHEPAVGGDGAGNFVVVWASPGNSDVFARRYDPAGQPVGSAFQANTYTTLRQASPSVAVNATGEFVVVWHSTFQDGSNYGVFGQRYDAAGDTVGPEFRVTVATIDEQSYPDVAIAGDGSFLVVWTGLTQGGSYYGVFGRRFDAAGNPLGADFRINTFPSAGSSPRVAANPAGDFAVAWTCCANEALARRFDAAGAPITPPFAFTTQRAFDADVAIDADGEFLVAWSGYAGIQARRFDAGGAALGDPFAVSKYFTGSEIDPSVAMGPDGRYVVTWSVVPPGAPPTARDIVAASFDSAGERLGPEIRVNTYTTGPQRFPSVALGASGDFVVVWHEEPGFGSSRMGVFGRRYVTPPDLVFADGFESGDLSAWSASQTDGGDLSVSAGAAMAGTAFGVAATVDDVAGLYVQDDSPSAETRYRARFYLDPSGFDPGEAAGNLRTRVFLAFSEVPFKRLIQVVLRRTGGAYAVAAHVRRDDDTLAETPFVAISPGPHSIELDWFRAKNPGTNDGTFELWIDGTSVGTLSALDNDARSVDFVRLGALSVKEAAAGTLRFDEFESRRWTYIGPLP